MAKGLDLTTPDDQARFAHLATPLIETVPQGVLKGLLIDRLGRYAGQAAVRQVQDSPSPLQVKAERASQNRSSTSGGSDHSESVGQNAPSNKVEWQENQRTRRLLMMLLKAPRFGQQLPADQAQAVDDVPSLFVQVLRYVRKRTDIEVGMADILGYWAGQADEPLLLELAGEQPLLPPDFV